MKLIKYILAVYLMVWLVIPGDALRSLAKLPDFARHFQHHVAMDGDISLIAFVAEHLSGIEMHSHHEGHHDFPCDQGHPENCTQHHIYLPLHDKPGISLCNTDSGLLIIQFEDSNTFSGHGQSVWQPPNTLS